MNNFTLPELSQTNLIKPDVHDDEETQLPPFKAHTSVRLKVDKASKLKWSNPPLLP